MFSACSKRDDRVPAGGSPGARARGFWRRALARAIGLFAVLNFGMALPAQASTCAPATTRGTAPSDYQNYCWLDFTGYNDALAQAGGQPFSFTLPDGSTLSLTLKVTTNKGNPALNAHAVPSWSGSAIGNTGFNGVPGSPVLYESQNGSTVTVALNNISVTPPLGSGVTDTYAIIAADGESTNGGESLQFTTNGNAWAQVAQIANGGAYPTVSGVGSATVTETGVAGTVGAFAFASFNNPTQITAIMVGGGLQGAMFAVRYASMSVAAQFNGARANAADQFIYSIKTLGGTTLASGTTTGAGTGPFPAASLATIAAGYPFVVTEAQAPGSVSPLADYAVSLTCTNQATGSSTTALPNNLAATSYTFSGLQYGDAISCLFTDTANRTNLTIAKSGPANVNAGAALAYTLVAGNAGPLPSAAGALVQDPAVANFSVTGVTCTSATGGAACPAIAQLTIANLQGAGIAIPTLPSGGTVTLLVSGTAGTANITNTAAITAPPGVINSNPTPTSTVATTVTAAADLATTLGFPASVNAGQPVSGTVLYTNNGPSTASGITYTLSVAANLAVAPTVTGLPAGASYAYVPATGVITLSGMPATLASGTNVGPITVGYTQPGSATSTVSASINATTTDPNPANNSATVTIARSAGADLATKLTFPAHANAGQPVAGTVLFTNNGPSSASGISYTMSVAANLTAAPTLTGLPAGASFTYVPATGVITLSGMPATLASGANVGPISVGYTQPGSATSTVSASINATTTDPNPANNAATATITGITLADVAVKLNFPATVNAGQPVSGTVLYTNNGPSSASGITFTLTVTANLAVAPTLTGLPAGASFTYVPATGVITLSGMPATLPSGANVGPINLSYTQPASGKSTVHAAIASTTSDPDPANGSATLTITGAAAELAGMVFVDNNQDGIFDAGDSPIPGATVQLLAGTRLVASALTNAAGVYVFANQAPGQYSVSVIPQKGFVSDTPSPVAVTLGGAAPAPVNFGLIPAGEVGALVLTKSSPLVNISAGQSVPYTITAKNSQSTAIQNSTVTDLMPAGFGFYAGSGAINGKKTQPTVSGRQLTWTHLNFAPGETKTFTLVLTAGSGVGGGEYVNQASAYSGLTHGLISNLATATVRIVGDPTFDCPDLIGKVFDDVNANGVQDPGEKGIAGVRLVTVQGLLVSTDAEGRYHIACPPISNNSSGTNFVVKVDERTLPSGYRLTTDNPETVVLTPGKVSKLNFGATIHHVVRVEVNDAAYDGNALRPAVAERLDSLVASLKDQASIVRLAYESTNESDALVNARLEVLKSAVAALWKAKDCRYPLRIEEDIVRSIPPADASGARKP